MVARAFAGILAWLIWLAGAPAQAQSVADFYRGKTIAYILAVPDGASWGLYARTFIEHLRNHIPGSTKFKSVRGYKGGAEIDIAIERGEVNGRATTWETWPAAHPDWLRDNKIVHLVQLGPRKLAAIGDGVPLLRDLVSDPQQKAIVDFVGLSRRPAASRQVASASFHEPVRRLHRAGRYLLERGSVRYHAACARR